MRGNKKYQFLTALLVFAVATAGVYVYYTRHITGNFFYHEVHF